jgi:uncharacterized protein (DUF58 family)
MAESMKKRYIGLLTCFCASAMFLIFQGGKVAFMIFSMVTILCIYLLMGRWSGIVRANGERELDHLGAGMELEAGASLGVRIRLHIPGVWPIPYVIVRDKLVRKNGESYTFESSFVPDWKRRGEVSYRTPPLRRGIYTFQETACITEDIFGLFRHEGKLSMEKTIRVLPKTIPIRDWKYFHHLAKGIYDHSAHARALRETTQLNGVREYVYGDRLARIHWNATARTGVWKSKEFERESLPKMMLVLDANHKGYSSPEHFELAVSVLASLIRFGKWRQWSQGMVVTGKKPIVLSPGKDSEHRQAMMRLLIEVEADGTAPLTQMLFQLEPQMDSKCFVVLVTPHAPVQLEALQRWAGRKQHVLCHLWIDPRSVQMAGNVTDGHPHHLKSYHIRSLEHLPQMLEGF